MTVPHSVRKTVTVVFCDVTDSTGLGERLDPELLRRVMSRWFDVMREALEAHGGTVEKFIGDAIMAVFGVPSVHEDDALRAVRAAAEMRRRLETLNEELAHAGGASLEMRVGINTGEVVAGDPTSGHTLVTGDAVNIAKRLEEAAGPGEILIGKATYPLIKDAVKVGPLERFAAKGKRDETERRRVDEIDRHAPGLIRRLDVPMVGREAELDLMREAFRRTVEERRCRLFTVLGLAGIGKSRLASEFCGSVAGGTTLTGRCLPYGEGITFWPLVEIVRDLGGEDGLRKALGPGEEIDTIVERVLAAVGLSSVPARSEETFWAVRRAFELLARERPLVVCFEDIHWAEPTFLDLIEYLVGWSRDAPLFVLCLARPEIVEQRPTLIALQETADSVALEPLSTAETTALLDRLGGEVTLDADARGRIAAAAEGNPLFLEQIAAMAAETGADGPLAVPPSIHALLAERLDRLTPEEQRVIRRASVIGRDFSARDVIELSPSNERPLVASHLLALLRKGLVHPDVSRVGPDDRFRFHHVLVRDTAYEGLPKEVRAELHERLADQVEERAARAGELDEIAGYHLEQAYRARAELGLVDTSTEELGRRASALLASAGRRALERADMRAAATLIGRASALLEPGNPERLALAPDHATALVVTGDLALADRLLAEAIDGASAAGLRGVEARCRVVRANLRFSTHPTDAVAEAERVAAEAIRTFGELSDETGLAKAWHLLAYADATRGRWADTIERNQQALLHAERAGDRHEQTSILTFLPLALSYGPTPVEEAIPRCEEIRGRARGDRWLEAGVAAILAPLVAMDGRFEEARALAAEGTAVLEDLGSPVWLANARAFSAHVEILAGRPRDAERELRLAHETFARIGDRVNATAAAALLAEALEAQGRYEEADGWTELDDEAVLADDVLACVTWGAARAKALARGRHLAEAERRARETVALADGTDALNMRGDAYLALAAVLRDTGSHAEADTAAADAVALYRAKGNLAAAANTERLLEQRRLLTATPSLGAPPAHGRPPA